MAHLYVVTTYLVVYQYSTVGGYVSPLVTSVACIDDKNAERQDASWDYNKWVAGVEQWQNNGPNNVKICDQFIELARTAGRCVYDNALMCELNTTNIDIGAAWIDTAGSPKYPGTVTVIIKNKNHFRWVTRSETDCHGHKMRVQFFGRQPNNMVKGSAVLACGVARAKDSNSNVGNHHDACRFKTYTTPS